MIKVKRSIVGSLGTENNHSGGFFQGFPGGETDKARLEESIAQNQQLAIFESKHFLLHEVQELDNM